MTRTLNVIGAGGFARQMLPLLRETRWDTIRFIDDNCSDTSLGDYDILPLASIQPGEAFVVAIASGVMRTRLAQLCQESGLEPTSLCADTARISALADICEGAVICDFAVVEPFARVGRHFHANVQAFVAHECSIGDFVTFGPGATCNGNVAIGDGAYIGAGAMIRQGVPGNPLRIGTGATVGMGAVVLNDVPDGAVVVGNPAKPLER